MTEPHGVADGALLEVCGIETSYGLSRVLFGVSLSIKPGEVVSLLGRNGMGKTTTVRSIMGLTRATAGAIRFAGAEIRDLPSYRIAKLGIGLVPEGRQVFPNLTARENLIATAANRTGAAEPWTLPTLPGSRARLACRAPASPSRSRSRCSTMSTRRSTPLAGSEPSTRFASNADDGSAATPTWPGFFSR